MSTIAQILVDLVYYDILTITGCFDSVDEPESKGGAYTQLFRVAVVTPYGA